MLIILRREILRVIAPWLLLMASVGLGFVGCRRLLVLIGLLSLLVLFWDFADFCFSLSDVG